MFKPRESRAGAIHRNKARVRAAGPDGMRYPLMMTLEQFSKLMKVIRAAEGPCSVRARKRSGMKKPSGGQNRNWPLA